MRHAPTGTEASPQRRSTRQARVRIDVLWIHVRLGTRIPHQRRHAWTHCIRCRPTTASIIVIVRYYGPAVIGDTDEQLKYARSPSGRSTQTSTKTPRRTRTVGVQPGRSSRTSTTTEEGSPSRMDSRTRTHAPTITAATVADEKMTLFHVNMR